MADDDVDMPATPKENAAENLRETLSYEESVAFINSISAPLAEKKLTKKLYKLIKQARKHKNYLRKGVKECQKFIRRGETGIAVFAGNVTPLEVYCHMPVACEEKDIPYCYVPLKEDLGAAMGTRKSSCMILVKPHQEYQELYDTCLSQVTKLPLPIAAPL